MLRRIEEHDLETIRRWRNHPKVRSASFTTHEILPAEHARWWESVRADPERRVLIYEQESTASGVVTYAGLGAVDDSASWGFYLDLHGLERAGALLRAWIGIEREAIEHAFGPLDLRTLHAQVLAHNEAVRHLHRRFGFTEVGTYRREVGGVLRDVVRIRLDREDA